MINKLCIFLILALLSGCAGNVTISYGGCDLSNAEFASEDEIFRVDHTINKQMWIHSSSKNSGKNLRIKELLELKDLECAKVHRIRLSLAQTLIDQLMSILPFLNRMNIKLEVQMKT